MTAPPLLVTGAAETTVLFELGVKYWLVVLVLVLLWQLQPGAEVVAGTGVTVVDGMKVVVGIVVVGIVAVGAKNVVCATGCGANCAVTGVANVAGTTVVAGITATGRKLV
jgi:hypothetical protein